MEVLTERKRSRARSRAIDEAGKVTGRDFKEAELLLVRAIQEKLFVVVSK